MVFFVVILSTKMSAPLFSFSFRPKVPQFDIHPPQLKAGGWKTTSVYYVQKKRTMKNDKCVLCGEKKKDEKRQVCIMCRKKERWKTTSVYYVQKKNRKKRDFYFEKTHNTDAFFYSKKIEKIFFSPMNLDYRQTNRQTNRSDEIFEKWY